VPAGPAIRAGRDVKHALFRLRHVAQDMPEHRIAQPGQRFTYHHQFAEDLARPAIPATPAL